MTTSPEQWVELYGDYLYNYAISRVNDHQQAFDLVQDTFLAALTAMGSFEGRSTEKTWLISILKRKIIDYYRKSGRKKEYNLIDKNFSEGKEQLPFRSEGDWQGQWTEEDAPGEWNVEPDRAVDNEELRNILTKCIEQLPEKWGSAFVLRVIEDISTDEVCKELKITPSNFWVIMHRAKLQLRECVEKNWILD